MKGFEDLGFAKWDCSRPLRNGFSEVIFCEGKTGEQIVTIAENMISKGHNVLGTRVDNSQERLISEKFPEADFDSLSRTFLIIKQPVEPIQAKLAVCAAGTADLFVAEEARRTAMYFGMEALKVYDVGVAGLHRLMHHIDEIRECDVVIAIAGMEGALPSLLGGLVDVPIVAVPTSVGYGTNFQGITPLLAMLNSCSEGIVVVNIDNGFGAACAALRMLKRKNLKIG